MPAAPRPHNETDRLAALRRLRVMDTPREAVYDEIATLAAAALSAPVSFVTLIDGDRQWFKACHGADAQEGPRDTAICGYTLEHQKTVVIEDAREDPRTADNPQVTGEFGLRFYAGVPLVLSTGEAVGSLCVVDTVPRERDDSQIDQLERLARVCVASLEARFDSLRLEEAKGALDSRERLMRQFIEHTPAAVAMFDRDMRYLVAAERWYRDYGLAENLVGQCHYDVFPEIGDEWKAIHRRVLAGETIRRDRDRFDRADGRVQWLRYELHPWREESGEVGGIIMFTEDITESIERERALAQSLDLLEQTQSVSGVGGWALDLVKGELHWTDQTFRIHGLDPTDGTPDVQRAIEFYAPEHRAMVRQAVERSIAEAEPFDYEAEIIGTDGTRVPVHSVGHPVVRQGQVVRLVGAFRDLTRIREDEEQRDRHRAMLDAMSRGTSDLIFVKDLEGRFLFVNPALCAFCGLPEDQILGRKDTEVFSPEIARICREGDREALAEGGPVVVDEQIPGEEGIRHFHTLKQPYVLPDGRVLGVIAVSHDVTKVRAAVEEARTSEERLNFALSAAGVGFWDHDMVTDRVVYADTWYTMLGYEPGEIPMTVDAFWKDLLHPEDRERTAEAHRAYASGEFGSYDLQIRLRHKSGAWHWVRDIGSVIEWDSSGRPTRMVGVHVDIDDRQRAQVRLETALVAAHQGLWEWSIPDDRCYFDEMWYRILGYEPGELPMEFSTWEAICHPEDLEPCKRALTRYLAGVTDSYAVEHRLRTKDGSWKWVLGTCQVTARDTEGQPTRAVGVNIDIDERKHAAQRLERALDEAESANAAKSRFLANMSHEIRTPMTAILGYAELMTSDEAINGDSRRMSESARIIRRNGEHLLAIINDILDISKIDAGKMSIESIEMSPLDVVLDVQSFLAGRARQKGLRFEVQQRTPLPDVAVGDPVRLRQILMNLVQNAVKFTESGSVTVRIEATHDPDRMRISVIDTGIGMDETQIARLFSAFQQGDDSMARRFGGTGLGLAISRRLAELMDGTLDVRSRLGRGSVFTLEVPLVLTSDSVWIEPGALRAPTNEGEAAEGIGTRAVLTGARVLLVEDGPDNQRLLSYHLTKLGANVTIAENGRVAVDRVREAGVSRQPFDVVLMDMQMPVMDGYEATRTLRSMGEHVPILALTAHAMTGDRERCLAAGCDDFETKPVSRKRLIDLCTRWIARGRRAA